MRTLLPLLFLVAVGCGMEPHTNAADKNFPTPPEAKADPKAPATEVATFAGGCFWCTEAVFQKLKGVSKVVSGYTGGKTKDPTYEQICQGDTGHAEAIEVTFDPKVISYAELLEVFWRTHDPTTLNRQGADSGTQYRSAIFYHSDKQKELAEAYKKKITEAKVFDNPIVTEITAASKFYPAEDYHQNYYKLNANKPYCRVTIGPKVEKLKAVFKDKLKPEEK